MGREPDDRGILSKLPSAGSLISSADGRRLSREFGDGAATEAIKAALACMRTSMDISEDREVNSSRAISLAESRLGGSKGLTRVINATGVVLHTNLGRAPLSKQAVSAAVEAAVGYTNLEYDLEAGRRGSRQSHVAKSISSLLGAESAIVVNNNAAAVLLCLDALAKGKKVAVSRGELVEIGGSFRVPEIISATGAELVEVGTTNRTRAADYEKAAREGAAALLKVHPSNFKVTGFVSEAGVREVAEVASRFGIPFIFDMGSGSI
ncbi:MAG TPA: L-seryl-tRNA(Sec) selenium transferase, partial [Bacillota bacterium]|nr:L-seryl-tRNA(Sec) selenium transferase [Bacillota bacterium]